MGRWIDKCFALVAMAPIVLTGMIALQVESWPVSLQFVYHVAPAVSMCDIPSPIFVFGAEFEDFTGMLPLELTWVMPLGHRSATVQNCSMKAQWALRSTV